jgi:hypothetical protein
MLVTALFVRPDSIYKTIPGVDSWDKARDARLWPGGTPVIAHPPCRAWGALKHNAKPDPGEKELAIFAVRQVQRFGGVLEHPVHSTLWKAEFLPRPRSRDRFGGWTFALAQHWLGHRAAKLTWFYIVGIEPGQEPRFPLRLDRPTHVVTNNQRRRKGHPLWLPEIQRWERDATPEPMARWLVELAQSCRR